MATRRSETTAFLKRQIESQMILSESGHYFLPESNLKLIFTPENIEKAVEELDCAVLDRVGLAKKIHEKGTRVFAILIKNGLQDAIILFRNREILDSRLPFSEEIAKELTNDFGIALAREHQWQFLPYKFRRDMRDSCIEISDSGRILPFVGKSEIVADGGFGDVSRVNISPSQQEFSHTENSHVHLIRKKIKKQPGQTSGAYDKAFHNEFSCILGLDRLEHPNIIRLLAAYTYDREHNFLFPAYEMDLEHFFAKETPFMTFKWIFTFYSALHGLSSAIASIHQLHLQKSKHGVDFVAIGYHHDIRPVNVLITSETFILADFGLSKLKSIDVSSQTPWKKGHGDYLAPECMNADFSHQDVGRPIDVWAFGCIIIEVVIYMKMGAAGLKKFRESRLSPGRYQNWKESCFHDIDGSIKPVVQEYLDTLTVHALPEAPIVSLIQLSKAALGKEPEQRPKMNEITSNLTLISLKAHFIATYDMFNQYMERYKAKQRPNAMKTWFGREKLSAFGYVFGLNDGNTTMEHAIDSRKLYDECRSTLVKLFHKLESQRHLLESDPPKEHSRIVENSVQNEELVTQDIYALVESLWSLLSPIEKKKAESVWLRTVLDTENIDLLGQVEHTFIEANDSAYQKGAAMAMMKKLRIEMQTNAMHAQRGLIISEQDVKVLKSVGGHHLGFLKGNLPVLIEWMYYCSRWENVSPEQRTLVMALKAQGFSENNEASGIRTLNCLGTFETIKGKAGYGFAYQIPMSGSREEIPPMATLLQLLKRPNQSRNQSKGRPDLGDKFKLASTLAQFFEGFHRIGWLHENFHPNNIVFFNGEKEKRARGTLFLEHWALDRPYIVGLNKSRPGGNSWETDGPESNDFQDYQHPEYASTKKFRPAYDYYSFGLVLLEIGLWQPLQTWTEKGDFERMDLDETRAALVERYVPRLAAEVGIVYRDVVKFCLSDGVDSSKEGLDTAILEVFSKNVVDPLRDLGEISI